VPVIAVNAQGQLTSASSSAIAIAASQITSGALAIANGGTGATSAATALTNLGAYPASNPSGFTSNVGTVTSVNLTAGTGVSVSGGPITSSGSITVTNTAPDQVVSLTGSGATTVTGTYPNFTISSPTSGAGTVTSINVSGGTTGLTTSGGPVTSSGTITLAGTLNVANGGTGATTLSSGYVLKGNGTSAVSASVIYDTGTNVGIGVTAPPQLLAVGNTTDQVGAGVSGAVSTLYFGSPSSGSGGIKRIAYDRATGNLNFIGNSVASPSTQMTLDSSGRFIVGTTAALNNNMISAYGASQNGFVGQVTNNIYSLYQGFNASTSLVFQVTGGGETFTSSSFRGPIFYDSDNTAYYMDLTSSTSINAGGSILASGNLTLNNGANRYVRIGSATNYSYDLQTTGDDFQIIEAGTTPRLTIKYPSGNVGIGTVTPLAKSHVVASTPTGIGALPSGVTGILDSSGNNYLLFRHSADNATYSGIAFQDNNMGGYVVFGNYGANPSDQIAIAGYNGGILQYGTSDTINPALRTTVASWNSTGLQINNGDMRAPIYYDSGNTAFYANMDGTSEFNTIQTRGGSGFRSFATPAASINSQIYFADAGNTRAWNWQLDENNNAALWSYNGSAWAKRMGVTNSSEIYLRNSSGNDILLAYPSTFGYSSAYRTMVLGNQAYTTVCIGVDPVANASGSFNGAGSGVEVMFKNGVYFISPNSANNSYNNYLRLIDGYVQFTNSARAPIFYDSDNTGYYIDAAGTSNLNILNVQPNNTTSGGGINFNGAGNSFIRGTNVDNATAGGANLQLQSWFGIGFGPSISGQLVPIGENAVWINARDGDLTARRIIVAQQDARAPIFYDNNNTAYYINGDGTSNLAGLTVSNEITGSVSGFSRYLPTAYIGGQQLNPQTYFSSSIGLKVAMTAVAGVWSDTLWINGYSGGDVLNMCALHTSRQATPRMWISSQASNGTSYGTLYEFPTLGYNSGNTNGLYAGVFYDSGNTAYYGDFASTSVLFGLTITGTSNKYLQIQSTDSGEAMVRYLGATGPSWYVGKRTSTSLVDTASFHFYSESAGATVAGIDVSGNMLASGSMRAPIFYDNNNTAYYLNPAEISKTWRMGANYFQNNDLVSDNTPFGLYFGSDLSSAYGIFRESGAWDYPFPDLRIAFHTGIKMGAAAGYGGMKFYTDYDMSSQVMSINNGADPLGAGNVYVNNSLQAGSSVRAPIFYDSNNTSYYLDPASTSVLNQIQFPPNTAQISGNETSSYGSIAIRGSRNGWRGIHIEGGGNAPHLMFDGSANGGIYFEGGGRWASYYSYAADCWGFGTSATSSTYNIFCPRGIYSGGRVDGTIFYDSNNTGYYFDGSATSRWTTSNQDGYHTFNNYGLGVVGLYASTRFQCVYAMGDAYKGNADGTSLSGAYGLWWSYPSAGGPAATLSSHGLMCIVNGSNVAQLDISTRAIGDMRAPIFYDLDNTAYYTDPAATSVLNTVQFGSNPGSGGGGGRIIPSTGSPYSIRQEFGSDNSGWRYGIAKNVGGTVTIMFYVQDNGDCVATGNVTAYSDVRLKANIETIPSALDKLDQIRGVTYTRTDMDDKERRYAGVIAQEIEAVLPEAVGGDEDIKTVDYNATIALLIEAVKELTNKVKALEAKEQ
jgi:hypothetical protein